MLGAQSTIAIAISTAFANAVPVNDAARATDTGRIANSDGTTNGSGVTDGSTGTNQGDLTNLLKFADPEGKIAAKGKQLLKDAFKFGVPATAGAATMLATGNPALAAGAAQAAQAALGGGAGGGGATGGAPKPQNNGGGGGGGGTNGSGGGFGGGTNLDRVEGKKPSDNPNPTDGNFNKGVFQLSDTSQIPKEGLAIVKYGYQGCPGCDASKTGFYGLAREKGDVGVAFFDLDTKKNPQAAQQLKEKGFDPQTVPALAVFRDGVLIGAFSGSKDPSQLVSDAKKFIEDPASKESAGTYKGKVINADDEKRQAAVKTQAATNSFIKDNMKVLTDSDRYTEADLKSLQATLTTDPRKLTATQNKQVEALKIDQKSLETKNELMDFYNKHSLVIPETQQKLFQDLSKKAIPTKTELEKIKTESGYTQHSQITAHDGATEKFIGMRPDLFQPKTSSSPQAQAAAKVVLNLSSKGGCLDGSCYDDDKEGMKKINYQHQLFTDTDKARNNLLDLAQKSGKDEAKFLDGPTDGKEVKRLPISDDEKKSLSGLSTSEIMALGKANIEEIPKPKPEPTKPVDQKDEQPQ